MPHLQFHREAAVEARPGVPRRDDGARLQAGGAGRRGALCPQAAMRQWGVLCGSRPAVHATRLRWAPVWRSPAVPAHCHATNHGMPSGLTLSAARRSRPRAARRRTRRDAPAYAPGTQGAAARAGSTCSRGSAAALHLPAATQGRAPTWHAACKRQPELRRPPEATPQTEQEALAAAPSTHLSPPRHPRPPLAIQTCGAAPHPLSAAADQQPAVGGCRCCCRCLRRRRRPAAARWRLRAAGRGRGGEGGSCG